MPTNMRLFQRKNGYWYIEFEHNKIRSLKTKEPAKALSVFRKAEKIDLERRLLKLKPGKKLTLADFTKQYLAHRESLHDLSPETIKKDTLALKSLGEVHGDATLMLTLAHDPDKLTDYKSVLLARKVQKITINGYMRHLKTAFRWAHKENLIDKMPEIVMYKRLNRPEEDMMARILEPEEIRNLLRTAYRRDKKWGNYLMVLLWTGGRRREALTLSGQKVDWNNDRITLTGKTGTRTVPMLPPVKKVLRRSRIDIGFYFDWHPDTVTHLFKADARAAGIPDHRLHDLRHTCATYLLMNKVPLEVVQRIMGHANISTTQIYAKVVDDLMATEMQKLSFKKP